MDFTMEQFPTQPTVYMRRIGAYGSGNYQLMAALKAWAEQRGLLKDGIIYGIAYDGADTPPEQCRYDVCLAAEAGCPADAAVQRGEIPGGSYAVFAIPHTAEAVQAFWAAFPQLLQEKAIQPDDARPILERYQQTLVESGKCEFCVPIRQQ